MKIERDHLKEIFGRGLQFESSDQRDVYLAGAYKDEPELRQEVDSLLRANHQACDFFRQTVELTPIREGFRRSLAHG